MWQPVPNLPKRSGVHVRMQSGVITTVGVYGSGPGEPSYRGGVGKLRSNTVRLAILVSSTSGPTFGEASANTYRFTWCAAATAKRRSTLRPPTFVRWATSVWRSQAS